MGFHRMGEDWTSWALKIWKCLKTSGTPTHLKTTVPLAEKHAILQGYNFRPPKSVPCGAYKSGYVKPCMTLSSLRGYRGYIGVHIYIHIYRDREKGERERESGI